MAENNTVLVVAVLAVIASLAAAGFSYYSLSKGPGVSGFASSTGTAGLTVSTETAINFSVAAVDFGSGRVNVGQTSATLETGQAAIQGSWSGTKNPLILDNIGNTNVSIDLKTSNNASVLLGGTNPSYQIQVTEKDVGACTNQSAAFGSYGDAKTSDTRFCDQLQYAATTNRLQVDVKLVVPQDSLKGALSSTITATGTAV
jgi:hypothetical protein